MVVNVYRSCIDVYYTKYEVIANAVSGAIISFLIP